MKHLNRLRVSLVALWLAMTCLAFLLPLPVQAADPPTLYETFATGNISSDPIANTNWTAQQFTVGTVSHTATSVWVSIRRVGTPGYTYLVLLNADSGLPIGYDLVISDPVASLSMPTGTYGWVEFTFDEYSLAAGGAYALCLYAPDGDSTNYVEWQGNSAGGLADGVGGNSTDNGLTWASVAPIDYLFQVWGYPAMEIINVRVFNSYVETGDWLITTLYYNDYKPYSSNTFAADCFMLQFLASDGTVLHQANMRQWGHRPGAIYLSPTMAGLLEWGGNYSIRMYGLVDYNPSVNYTLTPVDWVGDEMLLLDHWVYTSGYTIEDEEDVDLFTTSVGTELLNDAGHVIFVVGVPYLSTVRPDIFEWSTQRITPTEQPASNITSTNMTETLGVNLTAFLDAARVFVGVDTASGMGNIMAVLCGVAIMAGFAIMGHIYVGIAASYIGLLATSLLGVTGWATLGIITFGAAVVWVFHHFLDR